MRILIASANTDLSVFFFFSDAKKVIEVIPKSAFGVDSSHISFFFFIYYAALAGGFNILLENSNGGAQESRVKVYIHLNYALDLHLSQQLIKLLAFSFAGV